MQTGGRVAPLNALRVYLSKRGRNGELVPVKALNCTQGAHYLELAEKRGASESLIYGWMKVRVGL